MRRTPTRLPRLHDFGALSPRGQDPSYAKEEAQIALGGPARLVKQNPPARRTGRSKLYVFLLGKCAHFNIWKNPIR